MLGTSSSGVGKSPARTRRGPREEGGGAGERRVDRTARRERARGGREESACAMASVKRVGEGESYPSDDELIRYVAARKRTPE